MPSNDNMLADQATTVLKDVSRTMLRADRRLKRALVLATDVVACVIAVLLSFSIRLGYWQVLSEPVLLVIAVELALFITFFAAAGIYSNLFRFHGPRGLGQLGEDAAKLRPDAIRVRELGGQFVGNALPVDV